MPRNICAAALCLLSFLLLIVDAQESQAQESGAKAQAVDEVVTPNFRVSLPAPIKVSTNTNVSTPWGKATETLYEACVGDCNEYYSFSDFAFSPSRPLPIRKLKQARAFFLQSHKCVANDKQSPPIWKDTRGRPWPQTLFGGPCAASASGFLALTAIVNGHVYRVHVAPHTTSPDDALRWMIEHIHLTEKHVTATFISNRSA